MKKILSLCFTLVFLIQLDAQVCEPNPIFTEIGIWPIAADPVCQGEPYEQVYTIVAPSVIDKATVKLLTNGQVCTAVTLCSFSVGNFTGFPEGLNIECLEPDCEFDGGGTSCLLVSGSTNVDPGVYNVSFDLVLLVEETLCFIPITIPINQGAIVVQSPGSCNVGIEDQNVVSNFSWSVNSSLLMLQLNTDQTYQTDLSIFATSGQLVHQENIVLNDGVNLQQVDIASLTEGIYLIELTTDEKRQVFKILVNR